MNPQDTPQRSELATLCEERGLSPDSSATRSLPAPGPLDVQDTVQQEMITRPAAAAIRDTARTLLSDDIKILGTIAQGGAGWIREARQPSLDRRVAVKTLLPGRRSDLAVQGLLREAVVAGRLDHPNVIAVHALGSSAKDGPFMVMRRVDGETLLDLIARTGPLAERSLRELATGLAPMLQACRAVEFAHSRGIVHRDIKPGNIMLGLYGETYLIDWGSALVLGEDPSGRSRELIGTPAYMAPEVAARAGEATPATDIYLLGATLYHLLEGRPPHQGEDSVEVIAGAALGEPLQFGERTPRELADICQRACATRIEDRFDSAAALRQALEGFLRRLSALMTLKRAQAEHAALRRDAPTPVEARSAFDAVRFAYEEVLRTWPESDRARQGLHALAAERIAFELSQGNPRDAHARLQALDDPPPELVQQTEHAISELAVREQAVEELAALQRRQRLWLSDWGGVFVALFATVLSAAFAVAVGVWQNLYGSVDFRWVALALATGGVGNTIVLRRIRGDASKSRYYLMMRVYGALFWTATLGMAVAWFTDMRPQHAWLMLCLTAASIATTMTLTLSRVFLFSAMLSVVGAVLVALFEGLGAYLIGGGLLLNGLHVAWLLRPRQSKEGAPAGR